MSDDRSFFQQHLGGFIAGAAVVAFLAGPLLPLVPPDKLLLEATMLALGVSATWDQPTSRFQQVFAVVGLVALVCSFFFGAYLLIPAANEARVNKARCLIYEVDMTSRKPTWANSRELFEALKCEGQPSLVAEKQGHPDRLDVQGVQVETPVSRELTTPPRAASSTKAR